MENGMKTVYEGCQDKAVKNFGSKTESCCLYLIAKQDKSSIFNAFNLNVTRFRAGLQCRNPKIACLRLS